MVRVAGIVLAAGFSRRLGQPKQLVPICGKPALQHVLDAARKSRLSPLVLVVGSHLAPRLHELDTAGFALVINERAAEGQSTSLQAGLAATAEQVDAALFLLGDQPFVEATVIDRLIECFERTKGRIVRPRYVDGPGNPILIAKPLFAELYQVTGDVGARPVIAAHADE
ncbi:MAG: nucleotidyltransferase family protein, partial [Thermomicrobium sp.]|nr:nucleotidyltransferase family protein [Thermomicrobium sp.]